MAFSTLVLADSDKNVKIHVRGFFTETLQDKDAAVVLDLDKLIGQPKGLRIDSFWWLLEEKMGLRLWWSPGKLLIPMESRNGFRPDTPFSSAVLASDKWERKLYLSSHSVESGLTKIKYFSFGFDAEKQR